MWVAGCVTAGAAVAAGAFGAHALRQSLDAQLLATWETAARYQMYHSLALLLLASRPPSHAGRARLAGLLLCAGILLFSGSLYALALTGVRALGAITPLGGACWLAAWLVMATAPRDAASTR